MIALCVDDERLLLYKLVRAVESCSDITSVQSFTDELDALDWARIHPVDIAFLDMELRSMNGMEMAAELRRSHPKLPVVFCTAHGQYAVEAIMRDMTDGYLMKPITPEAVQSALDRLAAKEILTSKLLTVHLGKGCTIQDRHGDPVIFRRNKAEELFAALVAHKGEPVSTRALCEILWTDNDTMFEDNRNYLWTLFSHIRKVLEDAGAGAVMEKVAKGYRIEMSLIKLIETA